MNKYLATLLIATTFFALYNLGTHPLQDWDESRNGINAFEMLQNGDWVNLHFKGHLDDWNLKPPLSIWMIAASYSLFGFNEFALRFPSALSIIFATFFLFKIIRLYRSNEFAFFTCLMLISAKGWIGYHVGRTGDMDSIFLLMMLGGTFHFLKYFDLKFKLNIFYSAIFFGLAFWVKGIAMAVFFPSILLYAFFTNRIKTLILNKRTYFALGLFLIFPSAWFWINDYYGILFEEKSGLGSNAFTSMFWYDIMERFGNPKFINLSDLSSNWFFFSYLDTRFNVWNYFLYLGLLHLIVTLFRKKIKPQQFINKIKPPLILVSLSWSIPLCLFQNFSSVQHHWYLAPALPFIAIICYTLINILKRNFVQFKYIFFIALFFTLAKQVFLFNKPPSKPLFIQNYQKEIKRSKNVLNLVPNLDQSLTLYIYFTNKNQIFSNNLDLNTELIIIKKSDRALISNNKNFEEMFSPTNHKYSIFKKR